MAFTHEARQTEQKGLKLLRADNAAVADSAVAVNYAGATQPAA